MKNVVKYILIIALATLVIIQFIRPDKNSEGYDSIAAFEKETKPSAEVSEILKQNCYDCHSNQTTYPWYAEIAPFSYWLADHIKHGKGHFNASAWETYSVKKKDHKLEEFIEMVEEDEMPLPSYTWIHGNLNENDKKLLLQWVSLAKLQYSDELKMNAK
ncbi:heme-binding domain-containing protein [Ulvibacter litoralis]|uniref:Haem-binding domain-containing protein n=1 Tax=Ulvibacter litoralis TaxID=227084 RepID=A0A1G7GYJ8_9FLAO|nr:heme-binding domain-containing protein [Ulvibacter litoralis]GHC59649.1 heme-binding protein [Ulvibacter litoralis]SDE93171.1 Haem-binding domain-containing protein [Ulvibacter litoralis]